MRKMLISLTLLLLTFALAAAQGQPNYVIQPFLSDNKLVAGASTTITACMTNTGTDNSISIAPYAQQTWNFDVSLGQVTAVSAITIYNPTPEQPIFDPLTAQEFTITQGPSNPNKIFVTYTGIGRNPSPGNWAAGVNVCLDVTIDSTVISPTVINRVRFYGDLTTIGPNPPYLLLSVK